MLGVQTQSSTAEEGDEERRMAIPQCANERYVYFKENVITNFAWAVSL